MDRILAENVVDCGVQRYGSGRDRQLQAISGARFALPYAKTAQNADAATQLPVNECAIFNRHKWEVFVRR